MDDGSERRRNHGGWRNSAFRGKGARMAQSATRTPMAGGFLMGISILTGAVAGAMRGEASLGVLIGAGIGIALALLVWLIDRARR
jgi:hypothetical protein